ncbi:MAG: hypothetical protein KGR48_06270 [Alphaproteobacteria bacterium]|jgi:hypothetical protein|nr:hypothetical protein [Alphaproteobacteria bacterium]MDE2012403.1 hypothetical protein [Alphaproteobacteria bacterium]MDE2073131.1 hypothetical protein [Alphaproteobacteria bacterium]MDE2353212.1 hypothetical protein [Alphaproteobacteria bacterium]
MSIDELEKAVTKLSRKERDRLRALLEEMDAAEFDAKIERDAKSGKLDKLVEKSEADFRAGRFREL